MHDTIQTESWWINGLYLAASSISGRGIFTNRPIPPGEVVIRWGGDIFTEEDLMAGKARDHTYVGIGDHLFLANPINKPPSLDDFINHSCDGNLWMKDEITLIARKHIAHGEELTADYAIWLNQPNYTMKAVCNCKSRLCRRSITGVDWKLPNVQRAYQDHFSPFINDKIKKQNNE